MYLKMLSGLRYLHNLELLDILHFAILIKILWMLKHLTMRTKEKFYLLQPQRELRESNVTHRLTEVVLSDPFQQTAL